MAALAIPILPGKVEAWKAWAGELNGVKKAEFADFSKRFGLTRHAAYLQATPDGHHFAIVVVEGPGADTYMEKLAKSTDKRDASFKEFVAEVHGLDLNGPLPPAPELVLEYRS
jgi:hypothetical protein